MASANTIWTNRRASKAPLTDFISGLKVYDGKLTFSDAAYDQSSRLNAYTGSAGQRPRDAFAGLERIVGFFGLSVMSSLQNNGVNQLTGDAKVRVTAASGTITLSCIGVSGAGGTTTAIDEVEMATDTNATTGPLFKNSPNTTASFHGIVIGL